MNFSTNLSCGTQKGDRAGAVYTKQADYHLNIEISEEEGSHLTSFNGYKHVPWSSWDQWNSVRESLFSSSPDSVAKALQRISTWRSRGCLSVPIDVTAAIIEIQQKDPKFRVGTKNDVLNSEEMLAMLYCMAITRLVNCYVEKDHKKTGKSLSELAAAACIPRTLVDIRHEGSHRSLPSLPLVRMASKEAVDWLKPKYWECQRKAIPDVRKEVRFRLREMNFYLKSKHAQRSNSSRGNGKRFDRKISKNSKTIGRLYSTCPSQVVAVLLEFFHLQAHCLSHDVDVECSDGSNGDDPEPLTDLVGDLKTIIVKLSSKQPGIVLGVLKMVLEIIEGKESILSGKGGYISLSSKYQNEMAEINRLFSLVYWLLVQLKALKDTGRIVVIGESPVLSIDRNPSPSVSLTKLLQKILSLSVVGDAHLSTSVCLLAEMIGNKSLTSKVKKIPLPCMQGQDSVEESSSSVNIETMIIQEEASFNRAGKKLDSLKHQLRNYSSRITSLIGSDNKMWMVSKSWIPCPIGMIPCSFSSTAILPDLDIKEDKPQETRRLERNSEEAKLKKDDVMNNDWGSDKRDADASLIEDASASKRLRMAEKDEVDLREMPLPMEGLLLIDGVWKKVGEEELSDIESRIKVFTELLPKQN